MSRKVLCVERSEMNEEYPWVDYAWQKEDPERLDLVNRSMQVIKVVDKTLSLPRWYKLALVKACNKRIWENWLSWLL